MIAPTSPVVRVGIQAASPFAVITGVYLLFAGHNQPGGGFAAGLVFGCVVALRVIGGLQKPTQAVPLLSVGIVLVCAVAVLPLLAGNPILDQQVVSRTFPLLGKVKTGTAFIFDLGVTAIVIGLVIALLDGLDAPRLAPNPSPADQSPRSAGPTGDNQ